jgi:hypothetical protein
MTYQRKDITCHANDLIAHGWKMIGTIFWNETHSSCNLLDTHEGKGGNPICHWLSTEEEKDIVMKKCFWRSPLCYSDENVVNRYNELTRNLCLESSFCDAEKLNLQRWDLCVTHGHCHPYLTIRQIQQYSQSLSSPLQKPWLESREGGSETWSLSRESVSGG